MKTRIILAFLILSQALGNVMLSYGMKQLGDISGLPPVQMAGAGLRALLQPWVILGVLLLSANLIGYMTALSWADLSYVLPATALSYVLVALLSRFLLHEVLDASRWSGTALITLGVMLVARTPVRTT